MSNNDSNNDQDMLVDLQSRLAFQDQSINELNDVLTSQQQQIDKLQFQLKVLNDKLADMEDGMAGTMEISQEDEKPPHY